MLAAESKSLDWSLPMSSQHSWLAVRRRCQKRAGNGTVDEAQDSRKRPTVLPPLVECILIQTWAYVEDNCGIDPLVASRPVDDDWTFRIEMRRGHVSLFGDMDASTAPLFVDAVHHLVCGGIRAIDVNMAEVSFLDAAGVRALLDSQRHAGHHDVALWVHQPSRSARRMMELVGGVAQLTAGAVSDEVILIHGKLCKA
jgi:anti-sigma B factor antagonist